MPDQILNLLKARHASRAISTEPLAPEAVNYLAEAARLAPSCFNKQPWRYLFLQSEGARGKMLAAMAPQNAKWASPAPLIIVGAAKKEADCVMPDGRAYYQFDLGLGVMNILLAAAELDLVARPMAGFDVVKAAELFGPEEGVESLIAIAVGKLSDDESHLPDYLKGAGQKPRQRKEISEFVTFL